MYLIGNRYLMDQCDMAMLIKILILGDTIGNVSVCRYMRMHTHTHTQRERERDKEREREREREIYIKRERER